MNTKHKQEEKNQRQKARLDQGSKKQDRNRNSLRDNLKHDDHEHAETRMFR
jgi:hypothetical protein